MPSSGSPRKNDASEPSSRFSSLDKKQAKAFLDFCKKAAADENLAFLALVKKYRKANASGRVKYYHKIEVAHLHPTTSIAPVNLDASQLRAIQAQVDTSSKTQTKLPRTLFDEAESFIMELVDTDLLPKFQTRSRSNSNVY
jgi:hypothetical protein